MAIQEIKDRTDRLFGRAMDLDRLCAQAASTGLTAIVGPPQIGKSWLLMELARRLTASNPSFCVGLTRSPRGAPDPMLQVVSDLYQRWLADARAWAQLQTTWRQQKHQLLPNFARFVGKLSEKAGKIVPGVGDMFGVAINESLKGLVTASADFNTGQFLPSPLQYDQAQELVKSVFDVAGRPIALLMDQWDETQARELEAQKNLLRDFLREPDQWPRCRIFLGAREGTEAATMLDGLKRELPAAVDIYRLGEMDLSMDAERRRLTTFLRDHVPGIWDIDDDRVLDLVDGYPRVIDRWLAPDARESARTLDGLRKLVKEAIEFRYDDLANLLRGVVGDTRKLVVRIGLVPLVEDPAAWAMLRPIVTADLEPGLLDDLRLATILDKGADMPRFGHPKRRDAAWSVLNAHFAEVIRTEVRRLAFGLARSITAISADDFYYGSALSSLQDVAGTRHLEPVSHALCQAAIVLLGGKADAPAILIDGARQVGKSPEPGIGLVLSAGIFNTLHHANAENDLSRRDALLDELRRLAARYPDDAPVREQLANGLFNTLHHANAENDLSRRDALLDELRRLAARYPDDGPVREQLANGLFNTLHHAKAVNDLSRRDALLDELRRLAAHYPDDAPVRDQLAKGLFNTLSDAKAENDLSRRDALLDELRRLAARCPDDGPAREWLAKGLFNMLNDAEAENDLSRRDALLDELRRLAARYPDDGPVREQLANGLFNTLIDATGENDLSRRDALLDELHRLAAHYPDDAPVRDQLAKGLFNTLNEAKAENDLSRRDALLDELRRLASGYPDDGPVREWLANGLFNTLNHAKAENDLSRRDALLDELRRLAAHYPDDGPVREQLAKGLFNTLNDAKAENDLSRRDALLDELRRLANSYPDDGPVREQLANGLFNTLIDATGENDLSRRDALLTELRHLATRYPEDAIMQEILSLLRDE